MAEKSPELVTREEKIAQAKELYARGYRNYVVGDFNEAAEDLSRSCELYAELYGDESEEVSCVYFVSDSMIDSKIVFSFPYKFRLPFRIYFMVKR